MVSVIWRHNLTPGRLLGYTSIGPGCLRRLTSGTIIPQGSWNNDGTLFYSHVPFGSRYHSDPKQQICSIYPRWMATSELDLDDYWPCFRNPSGKDYRSRMWKIYCFLQFAIDAV